MSDELPVTEAPNPATADLDLLPTPELVALLIAQQRRAVDAAIARAPAIASAVDTIAARLERNGRLHYVGAGTSGRIGSLDAAEMPPTFGTDPSLVRAHIAGGRDALLRAVEGAEDDAAAGASAMDEVDARDAVVGISASGGAAFVVAALARARERGAFTLAIVNAEGSKLAAAAEAAIVLETGPEAIAGSTRLAAGTSQKIVLNALSTAVMIRLGKVHGHLMVDVVATNAKLRRRALLLLQTLTGAGESAARAALDASGWRVKIAAIMVRHGVDAERAKALLDAARGSLRALL